MMRGPFIGIVDLRSLIRQRQRKSVCLRWVKISMNSSHGDGGGGKSLQESIQTIHQSNNTV